MIYRLELLILAIVFLVVGLAVPIPAPYINTILIAAGVILFVIWLILLIVGLVKSGA